MEIKIRHVRNMYVLTILGRDYCFLALDEAIGYIYQIYDIKNPAKT